MTADFCAAFLAWRSKPDGVVLVDRNMMTGHPGIFAGGDMVPCERTVTVATGHGKLAARNIDAWLRGHSYAAPKNPVVVDFAMLHLPVFSDVDPALQQTWKRRPAVRLRAKC